jgi:hypothetical protein
MTTMPQGGFPVAPGGKSSTAIQQQLPINILQNFKKEAKKNKDIIIFGQLFFPNKFITSKNELNEYHKFITNFVCMVKGDPNKLVFKEDKLRHGLFKISLERRNEMVREGLFYLIDLINNLFNHYFEKDEMKLVEINDTLDEITYKNQSTKTTVSGRAARQTTHVANVNILFPIIINLSKKYNISLYKPIFACFNSGGGLNRSPSVVSLIPTDGPPRLFNRSPSRDSGFSSSSSSKLLDSEPIPAGTDDAPICAKLVKSNRIRPSKLTDEKFYLNKLLFAQSEIKACKKMKDTTMNGLLELSSQWKTLITREVDVKKYSNSQIIILKTIYDIIHHYDLSPERKVTYKFVLDLDHQILIAPDDSSKQIMFNGKINGVSHAALNCYNNVYAAGKLQFCRNKRKFISLNSESDEYKTDDISLYLASLFIQQKYNTLCDTNLELSYCFGE